MLIPMGILSAAGGVPADFELISTQLIASNTATVSFTSLPTTYKHLQLRIVARNSGAGSDSPAIRFNSDSGANYSFHRLQGDGSSASSAGFAGQTFANLGVTPGTNSAANVYGVAIIDILDFASTTKNKTLRGLDGMAGANNLVDLKSGAWYSTAAVTRIDITVSGGSSYVAGSRFSLYGMKG